MIVYQTLHSKAEEPSGSMVYFHQPESRLHLLEQAVKASTSGIVITDALQPDNPIIYINPAFEKITGYPSAEVLGRNCRFLQGDDRDQPGLDELRQAIAEGRECSVVLRNYRKDGSLMWNELHVSAILNEAGQIVNYVGVQTDFTIQKQAQEALIRSEARNTAILNSSLQSFTLIDREYQVLAFNRVALENTRRIWNRDLQEGDSILEFVHPWDLASFKANFGRALGGEAVKLERAIKDPQGIDLWFEVNYTPAIAVTGQVLSVCFSVLNINERKQTEASLRKSEELYRLLAQNLPNAAIILFDRNLRFTLADGKGLAHSGLTKEMLEGRTLWEVFPPDFSEILEPHYRAALAGQTRVFEMEIAGVTFSTHSMPVRNDAGDIFAGMIVAEDITERRRAEQELHQSEEQLRQAQKMEAVGRLAGGVAHDFNNMLTAILGYAGIISLSLTPDHFLQESVAEIEKAAQRSANLTRQLLAFSRHQVLQPRLLDLNEVILDLNKMLPRLIGEDIEVIMLGGADLGRVKADPGQIEQVILNLAVNARDAMPDGGTLSIKTSAVSFNQGETIRPGLIKPGKYILLEVRDTGHGMDAETQSHIFEPFFTTKELGRGTGLGLAMVYGIVQQSKGYITVESKPGHGATFQVYLPQVEETENAVAENTLLEDKPAQGWETILLVEDEEAVRMLAGRVLRLNGYEVLEARHGQEALNMCEHFQDPIHLLITDIVMPELRGSELATRLKRLRPEIKVLYMSGYSDLSATSDNFLATTDTYIQKPFLPASLIQKVRETLDAPGQTSLLPAKKGF